MPSCRSETQRAPACGSLKAARRGRGPAAHSGAHARSWSWLGRAAPIDVPGWLRAGGGFIRRPAIAADTVAARPNHHHDRHHQDGRDRAHDTPPYPAGGTPVPAVLSRTARRLYRCWCHGSRSLRCGTLTAALVPACAAWQLARFLTRRHECRDSQSSPALACLIARTSLRPNAEPKRWRGKCLLSHGDCTI